LEKNHKSLNDDDEGGNLSLALPTLDLALLAFASLALAPLALTPLTFAPLCSPL